MQSRNVQWALFIKLLLEFSLQSKKVHCGKNFRYDLLGRVKAFEYRNRKELKNFFTMLCNVRPKPIHGQCRFSFPNNCTKPWVNPSQLRVFFLSSACKYVFLHDVCFVLVFMSLHSPPFPSILMIQIFHHIKSETAFRNEGMIYEHIMNFH